MTNRYCVIQKGYAIFGVGTSILRAINNANEYLPAHERVSARTISTSYPVARDGEMVLLPCTDELYYYFTQMQGDPQSNWGVKQSDDGRYFVIYSPEEYMYGVLYREYHNEKNMSKNKTKVVSSKKKKKVNRK